MFFSIFPIVRLIFYFGEYLKASSEEPVHLIQCITKRAVLGHGSRDSIRPIKFRLNRSNADKGGQIADTPFGLTRVSQ